MKTCIDTTEVIVSPRPAPLVTIGLKFVGVPAAGRPPDAVAGLPAAGADVQVAVERLISKTVIDRGVTCRKRACRLPWVAHGEDGAVAREAGVSVTYIWPFQIDIDRKPIGRVVVTPVLTITFVRRPLGSARRRSSAGAVADGSPQLGKELVGRHAPDVQGRPPVLS